MSPCVFSKNAIIKRMHYFENLLSFCMIFSLMLLANELQMFQADGMHIFASRTMKVIIIRVKEI